MVSGCMCWNLSIPFNIMVNSLSFVLVWQQSCMVDLLNWPHWQVPSQENTGLGNAQGVLCFIRVPYYARLVGFQSPIGLYLSAKSYPLNRHFRLSYKLDYRHQTLLLFFRCPTLPLCPYEFCPYWVLTRKCWCSSLQYISTGFIQQISYVP